MIGKSTGLAALLSLAILGGPALAAEDAAGPSGDFIELRAKDSRVSRIGYALAVGNAAYCADVTPSVGLLLHDLGAYGDGADLRTALGLDSDLAIQSVVPGSTADQAGLRPDMSLAVIAGTPVHSFKTMPRKPWFRLEEIRNAVATSLKENGFLQLQTTDGTDYKLMGADACTSRFEVGPIKKRAVADGRRVVIGDRFPGHDWPDELLAGVLAHELAHNVLAHRTWLDANGRKQKWVRATEREADRLAPWLLANAGYEPSAAVRFMETWGPNHSGGLFRKRTHEGWDERVEHIKAEVAKVEALLGASGQADWPRHFRRENLPNREN